MQLYLLLRSGRGSRQWHERGSQGDRTYSRVPIQSTIEGWDSHTRHRLKVMHALGLKLTAKAV